MRITRTTNGRRMVETTLVEDNDWEQGCGVGNPSFYDHPFHFSLGRDRDGRTVEILMSEKEVEMFKDNMEEMLAKFRENRLKGRYDR